MRKTSTIALNYQIRNSGVALQPPYDNTGISNKSDVAVGNSRIDR